MSDVAFCTKCGFHGKPLLDGQHYRPVDGLFCYYRARSAHPDRQSLTKGENA